MRLSYHSDTDSLYIHLVERSGAEVNEVDPGIIINFDTEGKPVEIDIEHAQEVLDLNKLDIELFPIKKISSG